MQVILESLFAYPGSAPIGGGKKGEFWDCTNISRMSFFEKFFDFDKMRLAFESIFENLKNLFFCSRQFVEVYWVICRTR